MENKVKFKIITPDSKTNKHQSNYLALLLQKEKEEYLTSPWTVGRCKTKKDAEDKFNSIREKESFICFEGNHFLNIQFAVSILRKDGFDYVGDEADINDPKYIYIFRK